MKLSKKLARDEYDENGMFDLSKIFANNKSKKKSKKKKHKELELTNGFNDVRYDGPLSRSVNDPDMRAKLDNALRKALSLENDETE